MNFHIDLVNYKDNGYFELRQSGNLVNTCNAPADKAGVYLIYKVEGAEETLLYIGASGQKGPDGTLKVRQGGLYDRLVNGYHPNLFGEEKRSKRKVAFLKQMQVEGIELLKFYWYVTWDNNNKDFPTDIEDILQAKYYSDFRCQPTWHK